jgi:FAD/FMN-containing dehydrogenase
MAGGYTQGGGHSLLTGLYGLAADNVLEWEVVTADGTHLIVTPTNHPDLFWALGGGGGGTYGIVISMTVRLFEEGSVGRASLIFTSTTTNGTDAFWEAVDVFQSHLTAIIDDHGIVVTYVVSNDTLDLYVATAPNRTADQVAEIFAPMTAALATLGLSASAINFTTAVADTYYDHYLATLEPVLAAARSDQITSGRIVSRENMATNSSGVTAAMRTATAGGSMSLLCSAMDTVKGVASVASTAIQPAWHTALVSCVVSETWDWTMPWEYMLERQTYLTTVVDPALRAATPGSGTYLNEANFQQADWQTTFYGTNYARLKSIKAKYDPKDLLYGITAVGSEAWEADSHGRLCRTDA